MPFILYHTNPCSHTPAIRRVLEACGAPCEYKAVPRAQLSAVQGAVYGDGPVLVDGDRVIEDWRLILLHIDETAGNGRLTAIPPLARLELFNLCEEIEREILRPAAHLLLPQGQSAARSLLRPLLGARAVTRGGDAAGRPHIITSVKRLSADNRLTQPEMALGRLLFEGAMEFVRTDPQIAAALNQ